MDKRWIGIIIILIAGLGCMYLIVDNSTSVGNAVNVINDVTITLPPGYINTEDGSNYCVLFKKETNETMRIKCLKDAKGYIEEYNNSFRLNETIFTEGAYETDSYNHRFSIRRGGKVDDIQGIGGRVQPDQDPRQQHPNLPCRGQPVCREPDIPF